MPLFWPAASHPVMLQTNFHISLSHLVNYPFLTPLDILKLRKYTHADCSELRTPKISKIILKAHTTSLRSLQDYGHTPNFFQRPPSLHLWPGEQVLYIKRSNCWLPKKRNFRFFSILSTVVACLMYYSSWSYSCGLSQTGRLQQLYAKKDFSFLPKLLSFPC